MWTPQSIKGQDQKIYSFEKVLDPESTQQSVYQEVEGHSLCNAFLNGQNCTIFVYGPTSTGKTFTMQGNAEDIIHGKTDQIRASNKSQCLLNPSPDQSNISQVDDSIITNDFNEIRDSPVKRSSDQNVKNGGRISFT